jgi:16S rRNA G966 N2-methylase RsmD
VQLTPVHLPNTKEENLIIMNDFSYQNDGSGFDPVMYIGCDSMGLLNFVHAVDEKYENALDICAGTGIQAMAAIKLKIIKKATCVDINRRAIRFLHFNKYMNELEDDINIIRADITDEEEMLNVLVDNCYDVVLFNPPYIPSPDEGIDFLVFGAGGFHGENIMKAAASFLSKLNHNKTDCYIVANFVNCDDYNEKLKKWFGSKCVGCLFHGLRWTPNEYSNLVLPLSPYNKSRVMAIRKYEEYLIKTGVKDVVNGVLFFSFNDDDDDKKKNISIVDMGCEIWQILSGADKNMNIKSEIKSILHDNSNK